jgi:hypothetical protein
VAKEKNTNYAIGLILETMRLKILNNNNMKKNLFFLAIAASFMVMATSCKKDDPKPSIIGFWKGKSGSGDDIPSGPFSILLKSDNTTRFYSGFTDTANVDKFDGTFTYINNIMTATYPEFVGLKLTAQVNAPITLMQQGKLIHIPTNIVAGTFFCVKQ